MVVPTSISSLLKAEYLRTVKGLQLLARISADAFLTGIHSSHKLGFGQAFSQYRPYEWGDDMRMVDWKLFARSERFYVKQSTIETPLNVQFIIDTSQSMLHEDNGITKLDFTRYLVATLAWVGLQQGDQLGLYLLNDQQAIQQFPKSGRVPFQQFLYTLVQMEAAGQFPELRPEQLIPGHLLKKTVLFLFSDLYEHGEEIQSFLQQLRRKDNEITLLHIMGSNELELNYTKAATFQDLETGEKALIHPKSIRSEYLDRLESWFASIQKDCLTSGIDYQLISMDQAIGGVLRSYLLNRQKLLGR